MLKVMLILWLVPVSPSLVTSQRPQKTEKIKGTVVAESHWIFGQMCYHICGMRLIVRLDSRKDEYVVVAVEYMDDRSSSNGGRALELVQESGRWQFKGIREANPSSLVEHFKSIDQSTGRDTTLETRIAAWRLLPGAEKEVLPFGRSIVRYDVKVGKYKRIN